MTTTAASDIGTARRTTAVTARGLTMTYGRRPVLRGIDLEVRPGEILALLGPNGAGKTTTLEILEGFRRPSGGEIEVLGHRPDATSSAFRDRIGIVVQSWRDHGRWRVGELVRHLASYYRAPWEPEALLGRVGLTDQRDQQCQHLSGGQRRRLDVALGILGRPELLLLDEPTTGFDPEARDDMHRLIETLRRDDGLSILLTTHDLGEAERLADRIAILVDGRIVAAGTPTELAAWVSAGSSVSWTENGRRHQERCADPSALVFALHQRLRGPIPDLEVTRPGLSQTYLSIVNGLAGPPAGATQHRPDARLASGGAR